MNIAACQLGFPVLSSRGRSWARAWLLATLIAPGGCNLFTADPALLEPPDAADTDEADADAVGTGAVDTGAVDTGAVDTGAVDTDAVDACTPTEEVCDGLDNDCDGDTDEGFAVGDTCTTEGCVRGMLACAPDGSGTTCSATSPGSWTDMAGTADGSTYSRHAAVWTGSEMIVWGGYLGGDSNASYGHRYDPEDDEWSLAINATNAPSERHAHTAVWTGSEMIVWGGTNTGGGTTALGDGRRYVPETNEWRCMDSTATSACGTPTGAPSARYGHAAIWSGSKMLVWGGRDAGHVVLPDGAAYDPEGSGWSSISSPELSRPLGSLGHCAVWAESPSEMLIWGGIDESGAWHNDGARYVVAVDEWLSIPSPPEDLEFAPRRAAACAWTGAELLVVGGTSATGDLLSDGAAFDIAGNSWSKISTECAPRARREFSYTWTGRLFIIWGGNDPRGDGERFNTGGIYDPSHDIWWATATGGAPDGRGLATAVWTGAEMIVWGGEAPGGGRYGP